MACHCHCSASAAHFDARRARADRARYERHGPDATTRLLLEELRPITNPGDTLLDVGGGIGVLGLELDRAGLREVILVEAATTYLAAARELRAQAGTPTPFRTVLGDFTAIEPPPTADIVALDRVVCCYPDSVALLHAAAVSAGRVLALSFPRDRWYVRLAFWLENLGRRVAGDSFRTFVHPPSAMAALLTGAGWQRRSQRSTLAWCIERWHRVK
jgi:magnesium-protoporphyrin O-methyltransferase